MLPDKLKYYGFDWDDNLLLMPTKIYLLEGGEEVGVSTKDFAKIRHEIGKGKYELLPDGRSFRDFTEEGDEKFIIDSLEADFGPSWLEFEKCINNARIFSIITARGHSSDAIIRAIEKMILTRHGGINPSDIAERMHTYMFFARKKDPSTELLYNDEDLIKKYLSLARIYPVSNTREMQALGINASAISPEIAKQNALRHFAEHVLEKVDTIVSDIYEKPVVKLGFSDDDKANVEGMKSFIENGGIEGEIVHYLYDTSGNKIKRAL